jgi:hypothetical protein
MEAVTAPFYLTRFSFFIKGVVQKDGLNPIPVVS